MTSFPWVRKALKTRSSRRSPDALVSSPPEAGPARHGDHHRCEMSQRRMVSPDRPEGTRFAISLVMIFLTSTGRPVSRALTEGLKRQGHPVRSPFTATSVEMVVSALGCRAIVYSAGDSMLAGQLNPSPSPARARQVLLAAAMPGVELLVGIVPAGDEYAEEEALLQSADIPAVVLRCAPLVEELGADAPPGRIIQVTTGEMLATTVARALDDASWQGRTVQVPTIRLQSAWAAPRVVRRSSVADLSGVPAFACLSCASWW